MRIKIKYLLLGVTGILFLWFVWLGAIVTEPHKHQWVDREPVAILTNKYVFAVYWPRIRGPTNKKW